MSMLLTLFPLITSAVSTILLRNRKLPRRHLQNKAGHMVCVLFPIFHATKLFPLMELFIYEENNARLDYHILNINDVI